MRDDLPRESAQADLFLDHSSLEELHDSLINVDVPMQDDLGLSR